MFYLQMSAAPIDGLMFDHLYRMRIGRLCILYKFQGEMFLYNCNKFIAITIDTNTIRYGDIDISTVICNFFHVR